MKDRIVKIVLIGAGSREFARGIIDDLVLEKNLQSSFDLKVVLVDIDPPNLEMMTAYARRCASIAKASVSFEATTDRETALDGADFVLVSLAVKRMELWEQDFRVPFSYGIPHVYGENGGPGAAFHTLRNLKILIPICGEIEKKCPGAWVLNFTNPEARILTAMLKLTKVKAIGLCHGFRSFRKLVPQILDRPLEGLDVRTAGLNHFFTYYKITDVNCGRDLIPDFESRVEEKLSSLPPLVGYLWRTFGALGYTSDEHIGEYLGFAQEFIGSLWPFGIERRKVSPDENGVDGRTVFEAWRRNMDVNTLLRGDILRKEREELAVSMPRRLEDIRGTDELAVPVIGDICLNRGILREAVNTLNNEGYIENLDRDTCVELPAVVDARGIHPDRVGRLPEGFASLIRQQQMVQRLLIDAFDKGSKKLLLQSLLVDPVSCSRAKAVERTIDHMLEIQKDYLPVFT